MIYCFKYDKFIFKSSIVCAIINDHYVIFLLGFNCLNYVIWFSEYFHQKKVTKFPIHFLIRYLIACFLIRLLTIGLEIHLIQYRHSRLLS